MPKKAAEPNSTVYEVLAAINKQFGEGTLMSASKMANVIEYRTSGSISLDVALGGGWAKSRVIDVIGKQGAGKTLLFDLAAVAAQKYEKKPSIIFDFEQAHSADRFKMLGGDPKLLHYVRAENFADGREMFIEWSTDMLKQLLASGAFACIAMDSTATMVSKAEYDIKESKGEEASTVAYIARAMSSLLRQVVGTGLLSRSGTTLFFMSQMRANIGGRAIRGIPPPDNRTGGRALPFYASVQAEVSKGSTLKGDIERESYTDEDVEYGHETKVRLRKNKCNAKQGRVALFNIYNEGAIKGLDHAGELTKLAVATGVIQRGGKWYTLPNAVRCDGLDKTIEAVALAENFQLIWDATIKRVDSEQNLSAEPTEVLYGEVE